MHALRAYKTSAFEIKLGDLQFVSFLSTRYFQ